MQTTTIDKIRTEVKQTCKHGPFSVHTPAVWARGNNIELTHKQCSTTLYALAALCRLVECNTPSTN